MFYRKKKNASGSYSVQVLEKINGCSRLVKSFGSSSDPLVIESLLVAARDYIERLSGNLNLFEESSQEWFDTAFDSLSKIYMVGPELILGQIFDQIGFTLVKQELFRDLVMSRLVYPTSKLQTIRYLEQYRGKTYTSSQVYRYMDKLHEEEKELVEQISYAHTLSLFKDGLSVVFYDVTTIYFEAEKEDELRISGFSKDGKTQHPQILLGLLVSQNGYPLAYQIHPGNTYEGHTLMPILEQFRQRYNLKELMVIADAGLLTKQNVEHLTENNYTYIIGARIKTESKSVKEQIINSTLKNGETYSIPKEASRLVIHYSDKRAKKDDHNRKKGLARLEKALSKGTLTKKHINNRGYNKYLAMEGEVKISINYEKFEADRKWDGLKGYYTNTKLSDQEILANYGELWKIEKAFRISKTDLKIRPIYHRKHRRIESHICISFTAYKVYKELERQLEIKGSKISIERALEMLRTVYRVEIKNSKNGQTQQRIFAQGSQQKELLDLFGIRLG